MIQKDLYIPNDNYYKITLIFLKKQELLLAALNTDGGTKGKVVQLSLCIYYCEYQTKMITASHTRETINDSTIAVIHYFS